MRRIERLRAGIENSRGPDRGALEHELALVKTLRGQVRLEGKGYAVQDGDILDIRFNV